ncbi:cell wall-associated NlpC family hydrolase [Actinoplanes lutulentus]|uniref:Cell wall-associated NlpC family hydrolase n=1 Tax=Actinoplanes lutulentus TaxID=1287878 RepID=A0A327Z5H4_9ACTN|nr:C40 family peptidase [Actinoplanes lutulentus]MBB2943681.1 cell wall-associated NlpC family hydrolase [Actinoplanes lutulentus]RAK29226.1 cell wall-associated NlpC family hydrolase [Actinoplanes lutulentus]
MKRKGVLRGLLCVIAAAGVVLTGPAVAHAEPTPASVEKQIDEQWNKLEPVIEEYNSVHTKLKKLRKQQTSLAKTLTPLQVKVDVAMAQVRGMAVDAYMQGPPNAFNAMLMSGRPTSLTEKLSLLDQLAVHQTESIANVAKLRDKYAGDKATVDQLATEIGARDKDLASKKKAIEKEIKDLQDLRIAAYGSANVDDGALRTGPCPVTYTNDKGGRAAQKACDLIGKPYVFGSNGPNSYDCSGLTQKAWASVGVSLEHYTKDQWGSTKSVSRSELKPGDLVFYYSDIHHVAIYIGGGKVVHAPHTGDYVRMATIDRGPIAGYRRPA